MKLVSPHLIVASHSIAESFISDNLSLSIEEGQEALLHCLQLLLVDLTEKTEEANLIQ